MRKIATNHWSDITCSNCGAIKEEIQTTDSYSEGNANKGDKHMDFLECSNCGKQGVMTFTPPTNWYKLKGPLFGEDENISELETKAKQL